MNQPIIIVGAGWAGLSSALTLVNQGHRVIVLEASKAAGGRARQVAFDEDRVDNGQHLLIGAYSQTLSLLKRLQIREQDLFLRLPFQLNLRSPTRNIHLKRHPLPFKLDFAALFLTAKGFTVRERIQAFKFCLSIHQMNYQLGADISVLELLYRFKQSASLITHLWQPLALAALTTPIEKASAQIFLNVLKKTFTAEHSDADFLLPKVDLSALFPDPVLQYLKEKGSAVFYRERVSELKIDQDRCVGVRAQSQIFNGPVILAIPPYAAQTLLSTHPKLHSLHTQLQRFQYQPITTIYFRFATPVKLPYPIMGLSQGLGQWMFDRGVVNQPNLLSVVISGQGNHQELDHQSLISKVLNDISQIHPLGTPIQAKVITEKRAAFSCEVGIQTIRPPSETAVNNLYLAGDFIRSSYPSTLESAIESGIEAATLLLSNNG